MFTNNSHIHRLGIVYVFFYLACDGCSRPAQPVELLPPGVVEVKDPQLLITTVPTGMSVTHKLVLHSRYETTLTNLMTASSCGCTSAELDKRSIDPGGNATLNCTFDANIAGGSRAVKVRIFTPESPTASFVIDQQFITDPERLDIQVTAAPNAISIEDLWQENHTNEYKLGVTVGSGVPQNTIIAPSSAEFIKTILLNGLLTVSIVSPPVGKIDEHVDLSFLSGVNTYILKIPITGRIRPLVKATPQNLNFNAMARGHDMIGKIRLKNTGGSSHAPIVELKGDWRLQSLEKIGDDTWELSVCLNSLTGDDVRYGQALVKGSWRGDDVKIPLTGDFAHGPP